MSPTIFLVKTIRTVRKKLRLRQAAERLHEVVTSIAIEDYGSHNYGSLRMGMTGVDENARFAATWLRAARQ
jgi:hypothetical protein